MNAVCDNHKCIRQNADALVKGSLYLIGVFGILGGCCLAVWLMNPSSSVTSVTVSTPISLACNASHRQVISSGIVFSVVATVTISGQNCSIEAARFSNKTQAEAEANECGPINAYYYHEQSHGRLQCSLAPILQSTSVRLSTSSGFFVATMVFFAIVIILIVIASVVASIV